MKEVGAGIGAVGCGLLAIVFVILVTFGLVAGVWGLRVATAGLYGRGEAHIQIQSAGSRITAYNHFFDLCAAIQGDEAAIVQLDAQLATAESERSRDLIRTSLAGVTSQRQRSIAQYNTDAAKDYTIGQFRDSDLPYHLAAEGEIQCAYQ